MNKLHVVLVMLLLSMTPATLFAQGACDGCKTIEILPGDSKNIHFLTPAEVLQRGQNQVKNQVAHLNKKVNQLEKKVDANSDSLQNLSQRVHSLENNFVTGLTIQQNWNTNQTNWNNSVEFKLNVHDTVLSAHTTAIKDIYSRTAIKTFKDDDEDASRHKYTHEGGYKKTNYKYKGDRMTLGDRWNKWSTGGKVLRISGVFLFGFFSNDLLFHKGAHTNKTLATGDPGYLWMSQ